MWNRTGRNVLIAALGRTGTDLYVAIQAAADAGDEGVLERLQACQITCEEVRRVAVKDAANGKTARGSSTGPMLIEGQTRIRS